MNPRKKEKGSREKKVPMKKDKNALKSVRVFLFCRANFRKVTLFHPV